MLSSDEDQVWHGLQEGGAQGGPRLKDDAVQDEHGLQDLSCICWTWIGESMDEAGGMAGSKSPKSDQLRWLWDVQEWAWAELEADSVKSDHEPGDSHEVVIEDKITGTWDL